MNKLFTTAAASVGILILGAAAMFVVHSASAAERSRFTTIDFPGAPYTIALGVNPSGTVVGEYRMTKAGSGASHGFMLYQGSYYSIDYPGSVWTQAWGINPQGDVVGQYKVANDPNIHGFILRDTEFTNIDIYPAANTMPLKIAPDGTIVGCYHSNAFMYGFVMNSEGTFIDQIAAGVTSMETGISPNGVIVGNVVVGGAWTGNYVMKDGQRINIDLPAGSVSRAWDISANGTVAGVWQDNGSFHGLLYKDGETEIIDVDLTGAVNTRIFGISANGSIVGNYVDASGYFHGFLMK